MDFDVVHKTERSTSYFRKSLYELKIERWNAIKHA